MATLKEDIKSQSDWIVKAFAADGYQLDYTMNSIIEVDRFFAANMRSGQPKKGGRLSKKGFGPILFSIGAYVGETVIKNIKGAEWITDDQDPEGELYVSIKLPNEVELWPIQKVIKRFENGTDDAIYPYVHTVTNEFTNLPFEKDFWILAAEKDEPEQTKPWWKFW
jgi:hypothetical protein